jgi:hypothetical protein
VILGIVMVNTGLSNTKMRSISLMTRYFSSGTSGTITGHNRDMRINLCGTNGTHPFRGVPCPAKSCPAIVVRVTLEEE